MRILKFIVVGQIIKKDPDCDFNNLVPGSEEEVKAEFSFSKDWNNYARAIQFTSVMGKEYTPKLLTDRKSCMIPPEALARRVFKIRVVGKYGDKKLMTNKVEVKQNGGEV